MTEAKEKRTKPNIPIREPHKRTKTGIFDNLRQLPHPVEEFLGHVPAVPRDQEAEVQISPSEIEGRPKLTGPSDFATTSKIEHPLKSESRMISTDLINAESSVKTTGTSNTEGPVKSTSLSNITPPSEFTGPVESTSPVENRGKALQFARPVDFTRPVEI